MTRQYLPHSHPWPTLCRALSYTPLWALESAARAAVRSSEATRTCALLLSTRKCPSRFYNKDTSRPKVHPLSLVARVSTFRVSNRGTIVHRMGTDTNRRSDPAGNPLASIPSTRSCSMHVDERTHPDMVGIDPCPRLGIGGARISGNIQPRTPAFAASALAPSAQRHAWQPRDQRGMNLRMGEAHTRGADACVP